MIPDGHYLVLFQNNSELRPSGGFIGSFATIDVKDLQVSDIQVDTNIYKRDLAFELNNFIEVPDPLKPIVDGNSWTMRDSNWDLDFRDSAQRVSWFYQQEGGETVDGVIALNATVLVDFLELTGPVDFSGQAIESATALDFLHNQIERQYYLQEENRQNNEPKSVLRELLPALISKAKLPYNLPKLMSLVSQELREKHIQLFSFDPVIEKQILENDWAGDIKETDKDYLSINNASIGGQKSSLNVLQDVKLDINQSGSSLAHSLLIRRTHFGDGQWPDYINKNYTRVVLPLSATKLEVKSGQQEIDFSQEIERGKLVVGFRFDVEPASVGEVSIKYLTPSYAQYELIYQKQSGVLTDQLEVSYLKKNLFAGKLTTDLVIR